MSSRNSTSLDPQIEVIDVTGWDSDSDDEIVNRATVKREVESDPESDDNNSLLNFRRVNRRRAIPPPTPVSPAPSNNGSDLDLDQPSLPRTLIGHARQLARTVIMVEGTPLHPKYDWIQIELERLAPSIENIRHDNHDHLLTQTSLDTISEVCGLDRPENLPAPNRIAGAREVLFQDVVRLTGVNRCVQCQHPKTRKKRALRFPCMYAEGSPKCACCIAEGERCSFMFGPAEQWGVREDQVQERLERNNEREDEGDDDFIDDEGEDSGEESLFDLGSNYRARLY